VNTPDRVAPAGDGTSNIRSWLVLAAVTAGFIVMALNWFSIAVAFTPMGDELHVSTAQLTLLISVFLVGVGLCHVPAGLLATRFGIRTAVVLGLTIESLSAVLTLWADDYSQMVILRLLAGVGTSLFIPTGIAAVSVWFRRGYLAFALGILSAGYSLGTTLGLYTWATLTEAIGWREAMALGGALGLLVSLAIAAVYKAPRGEDQLEGVKLTTDALRETLGNAQLWLYGLAFLGAYGAFFAASQLFGDYCENLRKLSSGQIGFAILVLGLAGIPGSLLGGWLSDRFERRKLFILTAIVIQGLALLALPVAPAGLLWLLGAALGFAFNGGWAVWQSVPGCTRGVKAENIGTAVGLMLTITAIGGFLIPYVFGQILESSGYRWGWFFLGAVTLVCAVAGFVAREPEKLATTETEPHGDRPAPTAPILDSAAYTSEADRA
jgi:predicted MFS family arabinose efflux permease